MDEEKYSFGKEVTITGQVVCNDEDEDLKLYKQCCEQVCKIALEIQKDKETQAEGVEPSLL
jgi:hypothetical protein